VSVWASTGAHSKLAHVCILINALQPVLLAPARLRVQLLCIVNCSVPASSSFVCAAGSISRHIGVILVYHAGAGLPRHLPSSFGHTAMVSTRVWGHCAASTAPTVVSILLMLGSHISRSTCLWRRVCLLQGHGDHSWAYAAQQHAYGSRRTAGDSSIHQAGTAVSLLRCQVPGLAVPASPFR
jgi:hypothetical protein